MLRVFRGLSNVHVLRLWPAVYLLLRVLKARQVAGVHQRPRAVSHKSLSLRHRRQLLGGAAYDEMDRGLKK